MCLLLDFREGRDWNIDWFSKRVEERSLYWLESRPWPSRRCLPARSGREVTHRGAPIPPPPEHDPPGLISVLRSVQRLLRSKDGNGL